MSFSERLKEAGLRELLTSEERTRGRQCEKNAAGAKRSEANEQARLALAGIWVAVARAIGAENPPGAIPVVSWAGLSERRRPRQSTIGEDWRRWRGKPSTDSQVQRHMAEQMEITGRNGQPAWDMMQTISLPYGNNSGLKSFYDSPMFLGQDGTVYTHLSRHDAHRAPNGTVYYYDRPIFRPGHDFNARDRYTPSGWSYPDDYALRNCASIEQGLANLVFKHGLDIRP